MSTPSLGVRIYNLLPVDTKSKAIQSFTVTFGVVSLLNANVLLGATMGTMAAVACLIDSVISSLMSNLGYIVEIPGLATVTKTCRES